MNGVTIATFVAATAAVAIITVIWVRRLAVSGSATEEYFTGGRALAWPVVAGSLLLTNLSTEQLVGLNGAVFKDGNLVGVAWEALAAFAMIATALIFLPRYLRSGFTTTPAFLEQRFDRTTRLLVSALFLFGYVTVLLPVVLYTGSLALKTMFQLDLPLWTIVVGIGVLGSWYAIFGGLKSVAISDTLNGVGLLIGGLAIPYLAVQALGGGSLGDGLSRLFQDNPGSLAVLTRTDKMGGPVSVPWDTLLTGMMFIQVFYWSTNQVIVQRAMGARSLAEGQKGVLFASLMKLVGPLMLCLPGIVALHMTDVLTLIPEGGGEPITLAAALASANAGGVNDAVYPAMVRHVLPEWSLGLFAAVLVGSILSSFNSALNSASTLFCLEFYEPRLEAAGHRDPASRAQKTVKTGKLFGTGLAIAAMAIAPLLAELDSIFAYLQKVNGLYSVPIISIFLMGVWTRKPPAKAAKIAMGVGIGLYGFFTFVGIDGLHWLHGYFICFAAATAVILVGGAVAPRSAEAIAASEPRDEDSPVDMTPWAGAKTASVVIVALTVGMYVALTVAAQ